MVAEDDEDETARKPHKASLEDEFFRHPHTGAHIRNPFKENKNRGLPITLQQDEFSHNSLHDTLKDWHCVTISESSLRELTAGEAPAAEAPRRPATTSALQRAALGRLRNLPHSYEFSVSLRKSQFQGAGRGRRRKEERPTLGIAIDKVNIEVSEVAGAALRVDQITEGLMATWNRTYPPLQVRLQDEIIGVNGRVGDSAAMLEELRGADDALRLTVRRAPQRELVASRSAHSATPAAG
mmetsp:Transcript_83266/g.225639  ORF Transcript_83266/g.225639 Transcript_83266/m.225639 type:complete len:239 (-) Transcript_83266:92-808(-)